MYTFGGASSYGCRWMDQNYDWGNTAFCDRCGESLNLAVNAVADVLHTFYVEFELISATPSSTALPSPTPMAPELPAAALFALIGIVTARVIAQKISSRKLNRK
jgi:hypothetical protein